MLFGLDLRPGAGTRLWVLVLVLVLGWFLVVLLVRSWCCVIEARGCCLGVEYFFSS